MRGLIPPGLARLALLALAGLFALAPGCARPARVVRLATTTSVESSGLLALLLPAFEKDSGITVEAIAVGSGRALDILDRRDADVALTHDADAERRYLDRGVFGDYRKLMFNDFLIAGPADDPARVRSASGAVDAMGRIAASSSSFASRADSSGTHSRELLLWKAAGRKPAGGHLIETGQGMAPTLRIASERHGYVLTDRATFTQLGPTLRLEILSEGDPALLNTYAVTYRQGLTGARLDQARRFFDWLADGRGRELIDGFAIRGQRVYTVWPLDRPRSHPEDLPHAR
jgi:tungstate transport system substrate-binding protein